jgi:hypothetical protein
MYKKKEKSRNMEILADHPIWMYKSLLGSAGEKRISGCFLIDEHMGLSENSVPLHPMVNDHYPY